MKNIVWIALPIALLGLAIWAFASGSGNGGSSKKPELAILKGLAADIYMSPTCGCCRVFESILSDQGVTVKRITRDDMDAVKRQFKVPENLKSCHTTVISGYVVEGHIPMEAIAKLVSGKTTTRGIAMPGMPSGSPGMPGSKNESFEIYELDDVSNDNIFMTI